MPLEDAVPMLKSTWNQGLTDLRLKKNLLTENKDMLTNKLQEISIKVISHDAFTVQHSYLFILHLPLLGTVADASNRRSQELADAED